MTQKVEIFFTCGYEISLKRMRCSIIIGHDCLRKLFFSISELFRGYKTKFFKKIHEKFSFRHFWQRKFLEPRFKWKFLRFSKVQFCYISEKWLFSWKIEFCADKMHKTVENCCLSQFLGLICQIGPPAEQNLRKV